MDVWFVHSKALPLRGKSSTHKHYVPGEPPDIMGKYLEMCVIEGFACTGWPDIGDLRLEANSHSDPDSQKHRSFQNYLTRFASIHTGDLIIMPAYTRRFDIYIGMVVLRDRETRRIISFDRGLEAYYYFPDSPYEYAHRVDVIWAEEIGHLEKLGGCWLRLFSRVTKAKKDAIEFARQVGLSVPG